MTKKYSQAQFNFWLTFNLMILLIFPFFPHYALAFDIPEHKGYVNDYGEMISIKTRDALEAKLWNFKKTDSSEIVILTVLTLERETIENFGIKVAQTWRIGRDTQDRGLLIIAAKLERKIRIEVGKGLEGKVTDLLAGRILNEEIIPRFKKGDFDGGFNAGVYALIDAIEGVAPQKKRPQVI